MVKIIIGVSQKFLVLRNCRAVIGCAVKRAFGEAGVIFLVSVSLVEENERKRGSFTFVRVKVR